MKADPLLMDALGPVLAHSYLTVRRSEADAYRDRDEEFEIAGHFYKY